LVSAAVGEVKGMQLPDDRVLHSPVRISFELEPEFLCIHASEATAFESKFGTLRKISGKSHRRCLKIDKNRFKASNPS
jgi:hypothetical protein